MRVHRHRTGHPSSVVCVRCISLLDDGLSADSLAGALLAAVDIFLPAFYSCLRGCLTGKRYALGGLDKHGSLEA
jgi:ABC-type Mn2+/Zn2+ transport system permease subunit